MKHKFKGQICVYCRAGEADTSDHVVGRKFFLVERRGDLPQVPACRKCNNKKAKLESYLMTVLPFGGKHQDAAENLETLVPPRLAKNAKLRRKLERGFARSGGTTIPLDHRILENLLAMMALALAWQHWNVLLGNGDSSIASIFSDEGEQFVQQMFEMRKARRVTGDLGNGTFSYDGMQSEESPTLTLWRFCMYGGVDFGGDPKIPGPSSLVIAVTGPNRVIDGFRALGKAGRKKIGRNDPCPCGSGKKFKKCHAA